MVAPADVPTILLEALAVQEAFRQVGFVTDEIYLVPERERLCVDVRRNGKEFRFDLGEHNMELPRLVQLWRTASDWWQTSAAARVAVFESSDVRKELSSLMTRLKRKGFVVYPPKRVLS